MEISFWSVSIEVLRSELSLKNILSPGELHCRKVFEIFFIHAVKAVINMVIEAVMQVSQPYAVHEVVLAASRSYRVPGGIVPTSENYDQQRKIIKKLFIAENAIKQVFACEEFWEQ